MRFLHRKDVDVDEDDLVEDDLGAPDDESGAHDDVSSDHADEYDSDEYGTDEYDEYDGPSRRTGLRWLIVAGVVVALALGAFLARSPIGDALRREQRDKSRTAATAVPSAGDRASGSATPSASASTTTMDAATGSEPASGAAPSATLPSTAVGTAAPTAGSARDGEVTTIRVVPAVRNVIVVANGTTYASDGDGTINLAENDRHGDVDIIGLTAQPALEQLAFIGWGDGDRRTARSLDSIDGPVAQLGFAVSVRVQAATGGIGVGGATITFSSNAGPLVLGVGEPAWVVRSRAVAGPAGLVEQRVVYTAVSLARGSATLPLSPLTYTPTPEAVWSIVA